MAGSNVSAALGTSNLSPFLFAGIGTEASGSELTVLSLLARPTTRRGHGRFDVRDRPRHADEPVPMSHNLDAPPSKGRGTASTEAIAMRLLITSISVCMVAAPALGDDVPFAERTPTMSSGPSDSRSSSLGELMDLTQTRHIKLWYAGESANWELALYTLSRIAETLNKATMLYQNIPIGNVVQFDKPLVLIQDAVKEKSVEKFAQGYADLTAACNGCHKSAGVGFIAIKKPTSSPFSDQQFDNFAQ